MAIKNTKHLLADLVRFIDEKKVRSLLDKQKAVITVTLDSLEEAVKDAYNRTADLGKITRTRLSDSEQKKVFNNAAKAGITGLEQWLKTARSATQNYDLSVPGKKVVYTVNRNSSLHRNKLKNPIVQVMEKELSIKFSRPKEIYDALPDEEKAGKSPRSFLRAAGISEFKAGIELAHDETTVGSAQFIGAMDYLSRDPYFKGFMGSAVPKKLSDVFGKIQGWYDVTPGKSEFDLKQNVEIRMDVVSYRKNVSGSDPYDWAKLKKPLFKAIEEWVLAVEWFETEGSETLNTRFKRNTIALLTKKLLKVSNLKATAKNRKKPIKGRKKAVTKTTTASSGIVTPSRKKAKKLSERRPNDRTRPGTASGPLVLLATLNKQLPEIVRKNMQLPGLENRTGTFADSVRATGIQRTSQGFPSIGYTYQKNPYSVYETGSGSRFADGDRDPRKVINQSIREIAAAFALGRFYTRRE